MRRHLESLPLAFLASLAQVATAADIVYVTDLEIFTYLAPCAADAISYNIATQTMMTRCAGGETELQSCICSNTQEFNMVSSSISTDVASSCGPSATDDVWSASKVMDQYCNQDETITFSSPTKNVVNVYITDLPAMDYLAPCAQSGLADGVVGAAISRCPEAAELMAPCVCSKSAVVSRVSESLRSSVKWSCSNNDDVTSAQNLYHEYCAMNEGTTSFATPDKPPGDMSYYITALPQFKSLNSCAQSGVSSAVLAQTAWLCGSGSQALASCVCIKSGMSRYVSSWLTSEVKYFCDNTATADLTSALNVFEYFCSAAEGKVVATVSESATETYPTASSRSGSGSGSINPAQTAGSATTAKPTGSDAADDSNSSGGGSNVAAIAGGVAGSIVALALVGSVFFYMRRKRQQEKRGEEIPPTSDGNDFSGKPELAGSGPGTPGSNRANVVPKSELEGGAGAAITELPMNPIPTPELPSQSPVGHGSAYPHSPRSPQELVSPASGHHPPPLLNGQPVHEFPTDSPSAYSPQTQQGMSWQSGPVEAYELDSNVGRANTTSQT